MLERPPFSTRSTWPAFRARRVLRTAALLSAVVLLSGCTSTYMGRWIRWNFSDVDDLYRFPARVVENAPPVFSFAVPDRQPGIMVDYVRDGRSTRSSLGELAEATATQALIVVQRDTILYEGYFDGRTRNAMFTSFSVAKSVTSLLAGAAIERGLITSIDEPLTRYLPELAERDARFPDITLRHLLDMRSGLAYRDTDAPWGDKPKSYYVPELRRHVLEKVRVENVPGEQFVYNTYNPILLGVVLERATAMSVAEWTAEALWKRLGMEFDASWSLDGGDEPLEKMESGFNARALDFVKLGRLLLRRGDWDGERIVSSEWIDASIEPREPCALTAHDVPVCYQRGWWIHAASETWPHAVGAWGHLGQYIYVFPDQELVIVRFGREEGGVWWPETFRAIAEELRGRSALARMQPMVAPRQAGTEASTNVRGYFLTEAGRIYYEVAGEGPAVVLLHDGIAHREVFDAQFRTLSEQYRVVRFDHRGFGLSDRASASYVEHEDLAQLLDHIGVEHASFIAGSAAAGEALDFALAYPTRVNRLILVGPSVRGLEFSAHFAARNRANSAPILKDDPTPEDVRRAHENWLRDPWILAGDDARARLRTLLEPYVDKHGAVSFEFYREPEWSTFARLDEVTVPVLIVAGEADIADVHAHSGAIEAALRDVRRIVVPDAGHLVYFEQPAVFNRLVVDFLAR